MGILVLVYTSKKGLDFNKAIRVEKRSYGKVYIFNCLKCNKEMFKTKSQTKTATGYCQYCTGIIQNKKHIDTNKTRVCRSCKIERPIDIFAIRETGHRRPICKKCINLLNSFGINSVDYGIMLKKQNGVCAICNKPEQAKHQNGKIRQLAVDQCHKTNRIRGLLCTNCNNGLGQFQDNVFLLQNAISYLEKYNV